MTDPTDNPVENTPVSSGTSGATEATEATEAIGKYERTEEIPALLGKVEFSAEKDPETIEDEDTSVTDFAGTQPENPLIEETIKGQQKSGDSVLAPSLELNEILAAMKESLATAQAISSKTDALYNDTECIIRQVNSISDNGYLLTAEVQALNSGTSSKSTLSKTFLTISSIVLALLVIFQFYMFASLIKTQQLQDTANSAAIENINRLDKKMTSYDKFLTKPTENKDQLAHVQPTPAGTENVSHTTEGIKEGGSGKVIPVQEKLNKLRNGLPEKRLIRKETGDWFIYNNKNAEEFVSDVDVIDSLNQAYRRIGRSLVTNIPMPACKALCILKPDGRGGTQIVMTKDFLPM